MTIFEAKQQMRFHKSLLIFILLVASHTAKAQIVDTLVDVGNYRLHFKIIKGNDTQILFESGGGITAAQWDSIITPVHKFTGATLITYDRQGFGTSDIDTANYTILNEIKGLEIGLTKLGYDNRPMILVGHSLGAFYNRVYASRNIDLVKGIIMLDPRIPSHADTDFARTVNKSLDLVTLRRESLSLYYVLTNMESTSDFVRRTTIKPGLPILNVMAERGPFDLAADNKRFQLDQIAFVKEGSNRKLLHAKGSSHNIPMDQPELVLNEIVSFYKKYISKYIPK